MRVRSILAAAGVACAVAAGAATYASAQEPAPQAQPQPPAPQPATPAPQTAPDPKAILESACTSCHGLDFVTEKRKDHADWEFTVNKMISRGADLNPDEATLVIDYLAKTYPADAPPAADPKPPG